VTNNTTSNEKSLANENSLARQPSGSCIAYGHPGNDKTDGKDGEMNGLGKML
jgi:hypothetical protein